MNHKGAYAQSFCEEAAARGDDETPARQRDLVGVMRGVRSSGGLETRRESGGPRRRYFWRSSGLADC